MKVGIISQYGHDNFGNKLQNYALQQVLRQYADTVITIRNQPEAKTLWDWLRLYSPAAGSVWVSRLLGKRRKAEFLKFHHRYIQSSRGIYCLNRRNPRLKKADICDRYCAGSDQVWKPGSGKAGQLHFLHFAPREHTVSYAASFGVDAIAEEYRTSVGDGLRHIRHLSVREEAGKSIVRELTGRTDVKVLIDPTMLLTLAEWNAILENPKFQLPNSYILSYFLGEPSQERKNLLAEKARQENQKLLDLMELPVGPASFLYLIRQADLVCTDSFHGSVFALLYRKPLLIFPRLGEGENTNSRLETLISRFSLEGCVVSGDCLPQAVPDYPDSTAVLEAERKKAHAFLDKVFREA